MAHQRLVDTSIWIAFGRIRKLNTLLSMPDLAVSASVRRELMRGRDNLAEAVAHLVIDDIDEQQIDGGEVALRIWMLHDGCGISLADAGQVIYASRTPGVILYMRDRNAQRVGARVGADVRDHRALVDDMRTLRVLGERAAERLRHALDAEFERSRR